MNWYFLFLLLLRVEPMKIDFRVEISVFRNFDLKMFFKIARAKIRVRHDPSIFGQIFLHTYYYTCAKSKMVKKSKISGTLPIWNSGRTTLIFARGMWKIFLSWTVEAHISSAESRFSCMCWFFTRIEFFRPQKFDQWKVHHIPLCMIQYAH